MIIKKIFEKNFDEEVHSELLKFGKGEFKDKYLIEAKRNKDICTIKTTNEFANFFVKRGLEKAKKSLMIKGVIISTFDLEIPFKTEKKQYLGIKQFKISGEINPQEILNLMQKYPRVFYALSFSLDDYELKIKPKAPKSPKPSTKGESAPSPDFCILKTKDEDFLKDFFFDCWPFEKLKVKHTFMINEISYPKDFTKMKPEEVREKSKRKGKIIREIEIDGKVLKREGDFEA
ncbi:MAG: hypothetical protein QW273_00660 [Candidatus Pacearchaeota archaeon]